MNQLTIIRIDGKLLADSREVAEMVQIRHSDLLEKIESYIGYLENGGFRSQDFFLENTYSVEGNNKTYKCYLLTKKGCDMVANKMIGEKGVVFTAAYVTKFEEMETQLGKPQFALPQNYIEALEALVGSAKLTQKLEAENKAKDEQLTLQAPKVALYDTAMSAINHMTMMHVAKTIGIGRNKLFDFLREVKVLMKNNLPYQEFIDRGYFEVRQYSITHMTSGIENKTQTLVSAKGMAYIHKLLVEHGKVTA